MHAIKLEKHDAVYQLELINGDEDNTLTLDVLAEWNQALDTVSQDPDDCSLLIFSRHPKTFCTGINLPWLQQQDGTTRMQFIHALDNLLLRIATFNKPTLAAINGNCYAGGALIAAACDFRYMRKDRGRFCYSEVKIKLPFTPVMMEIVKLLPAPQALYELSITADAWGGDQCAQRGVVDKALSEEALFPEALQWAQHMATKHNPTLATIKRGLRDKVTLIAQERQVI